MLRNEGLKPLHSFGAAFSKSCFRRLLNKYIQLNRIYLYKLNWIKQILIERNHLDEFKYNRSYKNYFIKLLIKLLYKKADKIIGISKKLGNDLANFANCKVQTIYNPAYDKEIYSLSKEKFFF